MLMSSMRESVPECQSCALAAKAVHSSNRRAAEIRRGMPVSFDYQGTTGGGAIQALVRLQENSFEPWINTTEHGGYPAASERNAWRGGRYAPVEGNDLDTPPCLPCGVYWGHLGSVSNDVRNENDDQALPYRASPRNLPAA